jgi:hypothetical protein
MALRRKTKVKRKGNDVERSEMRNLHSDFEIESNNYLK